MNYHRDDVEGNVKKARSQTIPQHVQDEAQAIVEHVNKKIAHHRHCSYVTRYKGNICIWAVMTTDTLSMSVDSPTLAKWRPGSSRYTNTVMSVMTPKNGSSRARKSAMER